jgi:hypothetical protein
VQELARARSEARARRDWETADRLRAGIDDAGWRVIDDGIDFHLEAAHPPDIVEDDRIRYGSSRSVPSRLDDPPVGSATVVLSASDAVGPPPALTGLSEHAPAGTSVVVVTQASSPAFDTALEGDVEWLWMSDRLVPAARLNAAFRRAWGPVVIVLDPGAAPAGDIVTPLVRALDDPTVAISGAVGLVSSDVRRFVPAAAGDVDALDGRCLAFRRDELASRGALDERFRNAHHLDVWWSLVLRDTGPGAVARRAVAVDLPLTLPERSSPAASDDPEAARLAKRDFYRFIDRFGHRRDLLTSPTGEVPDASRASQRA